MAHFAKLNDKNIVEQIVVVNNSELVDETGNESEQKGIDFCVNLFGGRWIQTSYNGKVRKNFAGIGFTYDPIRDAFIPPKPESEGWILDESDCTWVNPEFNQEDSPYI